MAGWFWVKWGAGDATESPFSTENGRHVFRPERAIEKYAGSGEAARANTLGQSSGCVSAVLAAVLGLAAAITSATAAVVWFTAP